MKHDSHYFVFIPVNLITYRSQSGKKYTEQKKKREKPVILPRTRRFLKGYFDKLLFRSEFREIGMLLTVLK